MDKGVKFVIDNLKKVLELVDSHPEYKHLKGKVLAEYHRIKYIKNTGNMFDHFEAYRHGLHLYAKDFEFLSDYGLLNNEQIADYLEENYSDELDHYSGIEDLIIGNTYANNEIANTFKCSYMGGMRRSKKTNSLVLIAKHDNKLYDDEWDENGILNYTGMGMEGDQSITKGQNKTLAASKQNGVNVYLFESYKVNEYIYVGPVELAGSIFLSDEVDASGSMRKVLKFPLKKINDEDESVVYRQSKDYEIVSLEVNSINNKIDTDDINTHLELVEGPLNLRIYNETIERKNQKRTKRPDYIAEQIIKTKLGLINEKKVLEYEIEKMMRLEAREQIKKMEKFFEERKDDEGYDILSFEEQEDGSLKEIYIEVKSTKGGESTPIDLTYNEYKFAQENRDNYYLYRIYNSSTAHPKLNILTGKDLIDNYTFIPTTYKVYL